MSLRNSIRAFAVTIGLVSATSLPARADDVFAISSPAFADGGSLSSTYMFDGIGIDKTA